MSPILSSGTVIGMWWHGKTTTTVPAQLHYFSGSLTFPSMGMKSCPTLLRSPLEENKGSDRVLPQLQWKNFR